MSIYRFPGLRPQESGSAFSNGQGSKWLSGVKRTSPTDSRTSLNSLNPIQSPTAYSQFGLTSPSQSSLRSDLRGTTASIGTPLSPVTRKCVEPRGLGCPSNGTCGTGYSSSSYSNYSSSRYSGSTASSSTKDTESHEFLRSGSTRLGDDYSRSGRAVKLTGQSIREESEVGRPVDSSNRSNNVVNRFLRATGRQASVSEDMPGSPTQRLQLVNGSQEKDDILLPSTRGSGRSSVSKSINSPRRLNIGGRYLHQLARQDSNEAQSPVLNRSGWRESVYGVDYAPKSKVQNQPTSPEPQSQAATTFATSPPMQSPAPIQTLSVIEQKRLERGQMFEEDRRRQRQLELDRENRKLRQLERKVKFEKDEAKTREIEEEIRRRKQNAAELSQQEVSQRCASETPARTTSHHSEQSRNAIASIQDPIQKVNAWWSKNAVQEADPPSAGEMSSSQLWDVIEKPSERAQSQGHVQLRQNTSKSPPNPPQSAQQQPQQQVQLRQNAGPHRAYLRKSEASRYSRDSEATLRQDTLTSQTKASDKPAVDMPKRSSLTVVAASGSYATQHTDIDDLIDDRLPIGNGTSDSSVSERVAKSQHSRYYREGSGDSGDDENVKLVYKSWKSKEIFQRMTTDLQNLLMKSHKCPITLRMLVGICKNKNYGRCFTDAEEKDFKGYKSSDEMLTESGVDVKKLEDCALQLCRFGQSQCEFGSYLDLDTSLQEQWDELDISPEQENAIVLRTKLLVRVKAIIERLYNAQGKELRRSLYSLKQIFQADKELVHEFVTNSGLSCLVSVGSRSDQNHQNYILRAIGQAMLYVDGMVGIAQHLETISWLYSLLSSKYRLVTKTALKMLVVFVDYSEANALVFIQAVHAYHLNTPSAGKRWFNMMSILTNDSSDAELLIYTMSLLNKTLIAIPDQNTFYDVTDCFEEMGMQNTVKTLLAKSTCTKDLSEQLNLYELSLSEEDNATSDKEKLPTYAKGAIRERKRLSQLMLSNALSTESSVVHRDGLCESTERKSKRFQSTESLNKPDSQRGILYPQPECVPGGVELCRPDYSFAGRDSVAYSLASLDKIPDEASGSRRESKRLDELRLSNISHTASDPSIGQLELVATGQKHYGRSPQNDQPEDYLHSSSLSPVTPKTKLSNHYTFNTATEIISDVGSDGFVDFPSSRHARPVTSGDTRFDDISRIYRNGSDGTPSFTPESEDTQQFPVPLIPVTIIYDKSSLLDQVEDEELQPATRRPAVTGEDALAVSLGDKRMALDKAKLSDHGANDVSPSVPTTGSVKALKEKVEKPLSSTSQSQEEAMKQTPVARGLTDKIQSVRERFEPGAQGKPPSSSSVPQSAPSPAAKEPPVAPGPSIPGTVIEFWERCRDRVLKRPLRLGDVDFTDLDADDSEAPAGGSVGSSAAPPQFGKSGIPLPPPAPPHPSVSGVTPPPPIPGGFVKFGAGPPPPPPSIGFAKGTAEQLNLPAPPGSDITKSKKTIKLHWTEWKPTQRDLKEIATNTKKVAAAGQEKCDSLVAKGVCSRFAQMVNSRNSSKEPPNKPKDIKQTTIWAEIVPVQLDPDYLQDCFENKPVDLKVKDMKQDAGVRKIEVLDVKRSNAINIGMKVLPNARTISTGILKMDPSIINREGIEKLLTTMLPTDEECEAILKAKAEQDGLPLGQAEQFLISLSEISHLKPRLELWLFKLDYETVEKEIADPLTDLKAAIDEIVNCKTLRYVISTILTMGNYLNGSTCRGFTLDYLARLPEVKDTRNKNTLLFHVCNLVYDQFPDSNDIHSELGALCRCHRVDWEELPERLNRLERDSKQAWEHHHLIFGKDPKQAKLFDFLMDTMERIISLQTIYRRMMLRFRKLLEYLGYSTARASSISVGHFARIMADFALEYRTTREKIIESREKKAKARARRKTTGKLITQTINPKEGSVSSQAAQANDDEILRGILLRPANESESDVSSRLSTLGRRRLNTPAPSSRRSLQRGNSPATFVDGSDASMETLDQEQDTLLDECAQGVLNSQSITSPGSTGRRNLTRKRRQALNRDRQSIRRQINIRLVEEELRLLQFPQKLETVTQS